MVSGLSVDQADSPSVSLGLASTGEDARLRTLSISLLHPPRQPHRLVCSGWRGWAAGGGGGCLPKWLRGPFTVSPLWDHMMFAGCKGLQAAAPFFFFFFVGGIFKASERQRGAPSGRLSALRGGAKYFEEGGRRGKKMEGRRGREENAEILGSRLCV